MAMKALALVAVVSLVLVACDGEGRANNVKDDNADDNYSYEEIVVDISIGEERASFSSLTQCRRVLTPGSSGAAARWYQTGGAVVGAFSSGKGFVLYLGDVCGAVRLLKSIHPYVAESDWPAGYVMPRDPKELPYSGVGLGSSRWLLYVFDDVRDPQAGQVYWGPDYFWREETDVNVHAITTRRSPREETTAWRKRWDEDESRFGWLSDFYRTPNGKVVFSGLTAQFRPLSDKAEAREWIAEIVARPENIGKRWVVAPGGVLGLTNGLPLYTVTQPDGAIDVLRSSPNSSWTTVVYRKVPDGLDPIKSGACRPFRIESDPRRTPEGAGIRLLMDGEDTGARLFERYKPMENGVAVPVPDVIYLLPYDTETSTYTRFSGEACLDPRDILEEKY